MMHRLQLAHLQGLQTDAVQLRQSEIEPYRVSASYAIGFDTVKLSFRPGVERDVLQLQTHVHSDENLYAFLVFHQHVAHWFEDHSPERLRYVTGEKKLSINANYKGEADSFLESGTDVFRQTFRPSFFAFLDEWKKTSYEQKVHSMIKETPYLPTVFEGFCEPTFSIIGNRHGYVADWLQEKQVGKKDPRQVNMVHTVTLTTARHEEGMHNFVQYDALRIFLLQHGFILRHGHDVIGRLQQWLQKKG